ncbi:DUF4276 family protein [Reichenbachiella sp. MSK19-1]|uniref:DUF4276 family protein n=1 Tax=Reichenbachiella sp. MSK19-1 TaxID=1897631 RepID=UPI000E6CFA05|nr:DUF4276 family protein [Reichenbachiella sp. MSK19-1]RJE71762.1 hypothetical protein BGP76_06650 [Reichenbachiella sp. MSK19-1]
MSKPAFIVDGFTEKLIINQVCPNSPVRRTDLNGKDVSISAIAKKVSSLVRLLGDKYYPLIVIIDREKRKETAAEVQNQLKDELAKYSVINQDLRISVADTMIENWIIADWSSLESDMLKPSHTDGINGASKIKKAIGSYNKTIDGVNLFSKCDPNIQYSESLSFRNFIDQISNLDCHYTTRIKNKSNNR